MPDTDQDREKFEAAAARLDRRRADLAGAGGLRPPEAAPPAPAGTLEEMMMRIINRAQVVEPKECDVCGREYAPLDDETFCPSRRCVETHRARQWAASGKLGVLRRTATPDKYRGAFRLDFHGGSWPAPIDIRSPRGPRLDADISGWAGNPRHVTLLGTNGCGKSMLAAELMWRAIENGRGDLASGFWVRGSELVTEDRELSLGVPRPKMHRAKTAAVVVVDDCGWGRDFDLLAELAECRDGRRPTIWTTHRAFSAGDGSLRALAPMIYDRMKAGWVIPIERGSGR